MQYAGLTFDGLRNRTCIARMMCELLRLGKEELHSLLKIEVFRSPLYTLIASWPSGEVGGKNNEFRIKILLHFKGRTARQTLHQSFHMHELLSYGSRSTDIPDTRASPPRSFIMSGMGTTLKTDPCIMTCQHKLNWVQGFQNWSMYHPNITKMRQSQVSYVSKQLPLETVNLWCVDWKNLRQQCDNAIKT